MRKANLLDANRKLFGAWARFYDCPVFGVLRLLQKKALEEVNQGSILDIGCGTGHALLEFGKRYPHAKLYGIDLSEEMLAKAKALLGRRAILKVASADRLPFRKNSFDSVLCTSAFHHFPKQLKCIKEMKRVLKPDGRLVLADENFFFLNKIIKRLEPGHVRMNSKNEFAELFRKAGLKLVKQKRVLVFGLLNVCEKASRG